MRCALAKVACPVLLMAAMQDDMVRVEDVRAAPLPTGGSRFVQLDCGHFDPYVAPLFATYLRTQSEFLDAMVGHDSPP
jgi:poly(3-hydroxyalkanoate) synthetase